jgi:hypothetical protein
LIPKLPVELRPKALSLGSAEHHAAPGHPAIVRLEPRRAAGRLPLRSASVVAARCNATAD